MTDLVPLARWWRQPRWARLTLLLILVLAATSYVWNLAHGGDFAFYEASARSMSESWRALLYGAFDPASTVTLDKLSGFAVPQALSIRLFGMSTSALALPQVIEGLVTVFACSLIALRWRGVGAGLVAAGAAASIPIFVSMFAHPMEDGLVTMALAVALVWWQRAVISRRWWPLLAAGVFIGVGFQAKMMQAWFILPALVAATFVAGSGRAAAVLRGRMRQVGRASARAATLVGTAVAASLAWMTFIQATPAADRPYVDGSTDNNVFAMVFGYNGIDRLLPGAVEGAVGGRTAHPTGSAHPAEGLVHATSETGAVDPASFLAHVTAAGSPSPSPVSDALAAHGAGADLWKLLEPALASQIGWLFPAAIAGLLLGLVRWWPRRGAATSPGRRLSFAMVVLLTVWLATAAGILSLAHVPHTAYVAALGVQVAVAAPLGWGEGIRLLRARGRIARLTLPAILLAQTAWGLWLATAGAFPVVLVVAFLALSLGGTVVVTAASWRSRADAAGAPRARRHLAPSVPVVAAVAMLAGGICWSAQAFDAQRDGSGGDASVGWNMGVDAGTRAVHGAPDSFAISQPALWGGTPSLSASEAQLVAAARAAGGGQDGRPLFLSDSWALSAPVIDATGESVLTDGGYSGKVSVFSAGQLSDLISSGRDRVFVVDDAAPPDDPVRQAVHRAGCRPIRSWPSTKDHRLPGFTLWTCM